MEFEGEDEVKVLGCGHSYHTPCISQWLQSRKICPICSTEVQVKRPDASVNSSPAKPVRAFGQRN